MSFGMYHYADVKIEIPQKELEEKVTDKKNNPMRNNDQLVGYIIGVIESGVSPEPRTITIPLSWIDSTPYITTLTTVMSRVASWFNTQHTDMYFLWDCNMDIRKEFATINCHRKKKECVKYTVAQLEEKLGHKIEIVSEV